MEFMGILWGFSHLRIIGIYFVGIIGILWFMVLILVRGIPTPLKNMKVSWEYYSNSDHAIRWSASAGWWF